MHVGVWPQFLQKVQLQGLVVAAFSQEAAQNGTGHVATANKSQSHFLEINGSRFGHESFSENSGATEEVCPKHELFCLIRPIRLIVSFSEHSFRLILWT